MNKRISSDEKLIMLLEEKRLNNASDYEEFRLEVIETLMKGIKSKLSYSRPLDMLSLVRPGGLLE